MRLRMFGLLITLLAVASSARAAGVDLAMIDKRTPPCRDFYQYANGAWIDTVTIPPSYPGIGAGRELYDRNQAALKEVLDAAVATRATTSDPDVRKLGILYASLLDTARADREGLAPIKPWLEKIDAIKTRGGLVEYLTDAQKRANLLFNLEAEPDARNSRQNLATLGQGGLGLPDRDYYSRTDSNSVGLRVAYVDYLAKLFTLSGVAEAAAKTDARDVLALETKLADASMTRVERRDPEAQYHKLKLSELQASAPSIPWLAFFKGLGVATLASPESTVIVSQPKFMAAASEALQAEPIATWQAYFRASLLRTAAPWLGDTMFKESFAFQSRLSGARAPLPVWRRAAQVVDFMMGDALGKAYVARYFTPDDKRRMQELVANLHDALHDRILALTWMSETTKQKALVKLEALVPKIGYPDKWKDYTGVVVSDAQPAILNLHAAQQAARQRMLDKIGHPVDRTEWFLSPSTVNAYYNPTMNEIVFPAGILQPPYFDPKADDAYNYGAIGMVIGHEMTHGFDDEGRKFDSVGNLSDWWTEEDAKQFEGRAEEVAKQFDAYVAVDTMHVNGHLTLGENIADLGGVTVAYDAWQRSLKGKPAPPEVDGFTAEQRFFLGFAQSWRQKNRPEGVRTQVRVDPHSPAAWRVNGPLSNFEPFRRAFGCKGGDDMVRAETITIW